MSKKRISLAVLLLLLIGGIAYFNQKPGERAHSLAMNDVSGDDLRDSVAGNSARRSNHPLTLGDLPAEELRDAVAANPAFGNETPAAPAFQNSNPRNINGGLGAGEPNPASQLGQGQGGSNSNPPVVSPSGPQNE